jgi:hypothetical protein
VATNARNDLVSQLRTRLSDDRASVTAFTLRVDGVKSALLELTNGFLTVTVEGSEKASSIRWALSSASYNTIGKLVSLLSRQAGYVVTPDESYRADHPSLDLRADGIPDIASQAFSFRHRLFSDEELNGYITEAISAHNPNYTSTSIPKNEYHYVLLKAASRAYRVLAVDTARRKGMDTDAATYLQLATDLDREYAEDVKRMQRVIPIPRADESRVGGGDVMQGHIVRRSARMGYTAGYREALPPTPPILFQPSDDDIEDVSARIRWSQNREASFSYWELWRDTQPQVERSIAGKLTTASNQVVSPLLPTSTQYSRASTSRQVMGLSMGANRVSPVFDGFFFWTAAELAGSNVVNCAFVDGLVFNNPGAGQISLLGEPLEPEYTYYYRLYAINWNGEVVPSDVLRVQTKPMRAKFGRNANGSVASGVLSTSTGTIAGGTSVTLTGTNFVAGTTVRINGKLCPIVSQTSTSLVVTTPAWSNSDFVGKTMDMVLESPSGLKDILQRAWTYTA